MARTAQHERPVILREPLAEPELGRRIGAIEVERLERRRADPLDVPGVKELVRDRIEHVGMVEVQRPGGRDDGAVPMLHAIAARPGQIVGDEGVVPRLELRKLAEDLPLLTHDCFDVLRQPVEVRVGARVVSGQANRASIRGERPHRARPEFDRAVHQILQVRRGELERAGAREQLRERAPLLSCWRLQRDDRTTVVEAARPHQRRRHVDVRVRWVNREVGAIQHVAENLVAQRDAAVVPRCNPSVRIRPRQRNLTPGAVYRANVVDVLREVVHRVPPGRRPAHPHLERPSAKLAKPDFDLHPVMRGFGK